MQPHIDDVIAYYSANAEQLAQRYERLSPALIHASWASRISKTKSLILDVGAGSGRDAAWLADMGHTVVAVEPADGLRTKAAQLHPNPAICWIDDSLPELKKVEALHLVFDVILVSAVWMHIHPSDREQAFKTLFDRLDLHGLLIFHLRHGSDQDQRSMLPVSGTALRVMAEKLSLESAMRCKGDDLYDRPDIQWETLVFRRPSEWT
jgi:protein-L-isoaspartate O-methyltransferase